jgi:cell division protein FtsL
VSTLHNSLVRFAAWCRTNALLLVAVGATLVLVVTIFATTFRLYDERQERLAAIEALVTETRRLADENAEQNHQQCEGINGSNETLRNLLDASISRPGRSFTDDERRLAIDTYRRLPVTDCTTGAKTYFDPPFPKETQ